MRILGSVLEGSRRTKVNNMLLALATGQSPGLIQFQGVLESQGTLQWISERIE